MSVLRREFIHSLSARLVIAFVVAIVITTVATSVPAIFRIRSELEQQAWARVADGKRVTRTIINSEKIRLTNLALHASQRPTLQALIRNGDQVELLNYLNTFLSGVNLDILTVSNDSGEIIAQTGEVILPIASAPVQDAGFQVLSGETPTLVLQASQLIAGEFVEEYYVTVGIFLDNTFTNQLAVETGFDHSVFVGDIRMATSLPSSPKSVNQKDGQDAVTSGLDKTATLILPEASYYTTYLPIYDAQEKEIGQIEIALPVDNLITANQRAFQAIIISTIIVAAIGSISGGLYARRLSTPIKKLTTSALKISQGDLSTPVSIPESPFEVATLAAAFEESRINTREVLDSLTQANAWSEALIQSVNEGIVTIDERNQITSFSHGAERITELSGDQVLNKSIDQVFSLQEGVGQFTEHLPASGGMRQIDVRTCNGRELALGVTCARLKSSHHDKTQIIIVLRDTTEEKAAQRLRSYFLANISHEFRTPLSALNASVELLLEDIESLSLAEIVELLNSIHFSVSGLQTLIDNLLESTNIEAGNFRIRRRPTDFTNVILDAIRVMKPLIARRQQNLTLNEPPNIPLIYVDPTRITQVLVNLLSNASKYSPMETTIKLTLEIQEPDFLRVAIADRGPGISPVERSNLFRRFVRLGDHQETQYGVGLGLSVVKTIVEEHSGKVGVDERPDGGSVFWFTLPLNGDM
jgi:PAS domain S-box-containing protein